MDHIGLGPINPSLLTLQNDHVSTNIWNDREITFRARYNFWQHLPTNDNQLGATLDSRGSQDQKGPMAHTRAKSGLNKLTKDSIDPGIQESNCVLSVSGLKPKEAKPKEAKPSLGNRFLNQKPSQVSLLDFSIRSQVRPAFRFSRSEARLSSPAEPVLQVIRNTAFANILDIGPAEINNHLVTALHGVRQYMSQSVGVIPTDKQIVGQIIQMSWLDLRFQHLPEDADDIVIDQHAKAFILRMIDGFLMPDTSGSRVPLIYLPLLEDLSETFQYSWGSAVLACLYRDLCHIARARVPLISFALVEWHPSDQVMRQFGVQQPIPQDPINLEKQHKLDLRGKNDYNWPQKHDQWIQIWNN
ncbi:hypothetical protein Lal_00012375 [Lupinus albus]|nr:hypothetical protein Lal_00012375 [Lupinus albus]